MPDDERVNSYRKQDSVFSVNFHHWNATRTSVMYHCAISRCHVVLGRRPSATSSLAPHVCSGRGDVDSPSCCKVIPTLNASSYTESLRCIRRKRISEVFCPWVFLDICSATDRSSTLEGIHHSGSRSDIHGNNGLAPVLVIIHLLSCLWQTSWYSSFWGTSDGLRLGC
jgi:hypothetical protein